MGVSIRHANRWLRGLNFRSEPACPFSVCPSACPTNHLLSTDSAKQYTSTTLPDVKWKTYTCILGFPVMGIWDPYTDGTDINAVDVCQTHSLVAVAYDSGKIHLFNYPVVVYPAPKREYGGHSSFVCNVRWLYRVGADSDAADIAIPKTTVGDWGVF